MQSCLVFQPLLKIMYCFCLFTDYIMLVRLVVFRIFFSFLWWEPKCWTHLGHDYRWWCYKLFCLLRVSRLVKGFVTEVIAFWMFPTNWVTGFSITFSCLIVFVVLIYLILANIYQIRSCMYKKSDNFDFFVCIYGSGSVRFSCGYKKILCHFSIIFILKIGLLFLMNFVPDSSNFSSW